MNLWTLSPFGLTALVWKLVWGSIGRIFGALVGLTMLVVCGLTLAGRFGPPQWPYDLANHFIVHYAALQGLALLIALLRRPATLLGWLVFVVTLGCFALNVWRLSPYLPPLQTWLGGASSSAAPATKGRGQTLSLLHLNVQGASNRRYDAVLSLIASRQPDIVLLSEFNETWEKRFLSAATLKPWRHRVTGRAHLAVFSKRPLTGVQYAYLNAPVANQTWLRFDAPIGPQRATFVLAHPPLPATPEYFARERAMLSKIAAQRVQYRSAWLFVGDMNMTPWSAPFVEFLAQSGLRDSALGKGVQASWPAWVPPAAAIPIDHVLLSANLQTTSRRVEAAVGSDHRPVWAEVSFHSPSR